MQNEKNAISKQNNNMFSKYIELFFTGNNLKNIIIYMCNSCTMEISDPIIHTMLMFLNTPVVFSLSEIGLIPFKNMYTVVYPYNKMTLEQRQFLADYIGFMRLNLLANGCTQMGGGVLITLHHIAQPHYCLDHTTVLSQFCKSVIDNKSYNNIEYRYTVCNIVLQQIAANTNITKDTMYNICKNVKDVYSGHTLND
jgi:hypothetical protein